MHPKISAMLSSLLQGRRLHETEASGVLSLGKQHRLDLHAAARVAASVAGAEIFTCGIINAKSGRCAEDCSFCAQSAYHATSTPVYGLVAEDRLLRRAEQLSGSGARFMGIVISGTAPTAGDFERLCEAAARIRSRVPIELCASFGLLTKEQALVLKQAGYASYHHNLETAPSWYGRVCTTHPFESRITTVKNARSAGLRVCSGGIFGLGEGWEHRLELSGILHDLDVDSIPINFLTPIRGTPLEKAPTLPVEDALDTVALFRLLHPGRDVVVCGGRSTVLGEWDRSLFHCGANGIMIGDYLTTKGSGLEEDLGYLRTLGVDGSNTCRRESESPSSFADARPEHKTGGMDEVS